MTTKTRKKPQKTKKKQIKHNRQNSSQEKGRGFLRDEKYNYERQKKYCEGQKRGGGEKLRESGG
jgi:hypothetical protein